MKKCIMTSTTLVALAVVRICGFASSSHESRAFEPTAHAFFPFCIDWHDAKKRYFAEQAVMLKELGYDGVGHIWLDGVADRLKTLDPAGLRLFQITMTVDIAPGKPPYDAAFKDVLALVKGRRVQFDLLVGGMTPSDPAGPARRDHPARDVRPGPRFGRSAPALPACRLTGSSASRIRCAWPTKWIARTSASCSTCATGCAWTSSATTSRCCGRPCPGSGPSRSTAPMSMPGRAGTTISSRWTRVRSTWPSFSEPSRSWVTGTDRAAMLWHWRRYARAPGPFHGRVAQDAPDALNQEFD